LDTSSIAPKLNLRIGQQARQLEDGLARHDRLDLAAGGTVLADLAHGQPVAVGGHGAHHVALDHQQHAVQVVADVLRGHREVDHAQQVLEGAGRQREVGAELGLRHGGVLVGRQRLQVEAALGRLHGELLARQRQRHVGLGQRAQDVDQLARGHGGGHLILAGADLGGGLDLDLEVGGDEAHLLARLAHQDVGEDRQGLPALDDSAHHLQWFEQRIAAGFDELHVVLPLFSKTA
jgi:hypothetical protein